MHLSHFSAFDSQIFFAVSLLFSIFITPNIALSSTYHAQGLSTTNKPKLPLPVEVIYDFPPGIWCENLAVRRNGQILVTVTTIPVIYQVDPHKKRDPILIYTFPASSVNGIAELEPDVFYVATVNITVVNGQTGIVNGTATIWKVDLRSFSVRHGKPAQVTKIITISKARLLNGVAVLNRRQGLLVIADSTLGLIWQLNVRTKEFKVFADDLLTRPLPDTPVPIGANGVKVRKGVVYFSNTFRDIIARIRIKDQKTPIGPAVVVVTGLTGMDDFAIGPNGAFFAAQIIGNAFSYAPPTGGEAVILVNNTFNPTAVAFGRRPEDAQSAYISCAGGTVGSPDPPQGKILKVDVKAFL